MVLLIPILALVVIAGVALAGLHQRLTEARRAVAEVEAREAAALRELAAAKRAVVQSGTDHEFISRFLRELPHVAYEMHASPGGRKVPALLLAAVTRLLEPKRALVAVARRGTEDEPESGHSLAIAAVLPEGWMPVGTPVGDGRGEIGFAVEVQRVMDRRDFDAQPAPIRSRLRAQSGPDCQPDLVAPLVFKDETVGVIAVEGPRRHGPEVKDLVRLLAHLGAASLYSSARYSEINKTANTDGLTGLFNKRFVTLRLSDEIRKALDETNSVSVFLFDIDNFKHYNDRNGHVEGDRLLRALARVVQEVTRGDTIFGRFGGEEFLMIFPGSTKQQALAAAENVREAIALHGFPCGAQQPLGCISVSGGVAECPVDAQDGAALLRLADEALYAAKRSGRNRVLACEPRYLGGEDAQEPVGDEEAEEARRWVALGTPVSASLALDPLARRTAYDASFAEARRLLAEGDAAGALEAARHARLVDPDRPAIRQLITAIEQDLALVDPDLIVVDEDEAASILGTSRRSA
jgi:diguanylate cyclase (GGDEF)-like protein